MAIVLKIRPPMDSDVAQVAIQSSSANTGSGSAIAGSPFYLKTGGVWTLDFEDPSGTLSRYYRFQFLDESGNTGSWSAWFKPTGGTYATTRDVWDWLNTAQQVVNESVGTGDGSTSFYSLSNGNLIDGTYELKYGSTSSWTELIEGTDYNIDLEKGWVKMTTTGMATASGSDIFADYKKGDIPNRVISDFIQAADAEIEDRTGRRWHKLTHVEYFDVEHSQRDFMTKWYPILSVSSIQRNTSGMGNSETWQTLTEGYGNDWWADDDDKVNGAFHFTEENPPLNMKRSFKITYYYGFDQIPKKLNTLSTQLCIYKLMQHPVFAKHFLQGKNTYANLELAPLKADIDTTITRLKKDSFVIV